MKRFFSRLFEMNEARQYPGLRLFVIVVLLFFWLVTLHRPYLPLLYPSFSGFRDAAGWGLWGQISLLLSVSMVLAPPTKIYSQVVSFLIAVFFFATATIFTSAIGVTTGSTTYTLLGMASLALFGADFKAWFPRTRLFQYLKDHPPKWFKDKYGDN